MKRILTLALSFIMVLGLFPADSLAAPQWPSNISIQAEGGVVMDANTGAVLYGTNMKLSYFPASITKVMTALVVIENADLDDIVTFSEDAVVNNIEDNSSNAEISVGDKLTVRECLYALLVKSANETANALAEHISGSNEEFTKLMNQKAQELGCSKDTHFGNPSGLNDDNNYVTAYDMALISRAAFLNPTFVEIDSTVKHTLPPTKANPDGKVIITSNKMMKEGSFHYPGIIGGKTGYTQKAGNTLVTCAERDGLKLISVVLKGTQPQYWTDTKNLLDFGFNNFKSIKAADADTRFESLGDLNLAGISTGQESALALDDGRITLPAAADFTDLTSELTYELPADAPENAIAQVVYSYGADQVGSAFVITNPLIRQNTTPVAASNASGNVSGLPGGQSKESQSNSDTSQASEDSSAAETPSPLRRATDTNAGGKTPESDQPPFQIPSSLWVVLGVIAVVGGLIALFVTLKLRSAREERRQRQLRKERRQQRLKESGYSDAEFEQLLERHRSSHTSTKHSKSRDDLDFK